MVAIDLNKDYQVLNRVNFPSDLRTLTLAELQVLCEEIRDYLVGTVRQTGGHLAPSLGAVELTVALHYVFRTPDDKFIWDVGHQAYSHKILTGRREAFRTIRQYKGLSGFCKRSESEYDVYGAGHASTSISAAIGFAIARNIEKQQHRIVSIIGDGSLTGGLALAALNNVYAVKGQFLVVLNDNEMSISPNVGAISYYLTRIATHPRYIKFRTRVYDVLGRLPRGAGFLRTLGRKILESTKNLVTSGILFEELGLKYYGPINGHDLEQLISTLQKIKDLPYPVMLHVLTKKGKGLACAEEDPIKYHGIGPQTSSAATQPKAAEVPQFLTAFGKIACEIGEQNEKAVFITAAMCEGTGLVEYAERFAARYFDVGIAEEHAVTFAGGLCAAGFRPVVAIYSTFLQRAYDHIIHDIALQKLPVVFALDRGGLVGADGPTHHGAYDLSYLNTVPGMIIAAPRNGNELRDLLATALAQNSAPFAIRYPKAACGEFDENREARILPIGSWEKIREGSDVAVISVGVMTDEALQACRLLADQAIHPTLVHARFVKPFDDAMLAEITAKHRLILTVEENSIQGGFGATLSQYLANSGFTGKIVNLAIPDHFIEQGSRTQLLKDLGLTAEKIAAKIKAEIARD